VLLTLLYPSFGACLDQGRIAKALKDSREAKQGLEVQTGEKYDNQYKN
jgi:hypothetical protein